MSRDKYRETNTDGFVDLEVYPDTVPDTGFAIAVSLQEEDTIRRASKEWCEHAAWEGRRGFQRN